MKYETSLVLGTATVLMGIMFASSSYADNKWGNYRTVERYPAQQYQAPTQQGQYRAYENPYGKPLPPQQMPPRPYSHRHYPPQQWDYPQQYPYQYPQRYPYDSYPQYPRQNGITIIYNQDLPTDSNYTYRSQSYVNGGQGASIQSSRYTLISDWRRYNLPAPNVGMHWVFQDGRYVQISVD